MTGRVFIVTGASSGLGYEVAKNLCEGGNDVILACRNEEKANRAIEKIKRLYPNAIPTYMNLDLSSVESIKKFVEDFRAADKKLNVLINNAGIALAPKDAKRQYTKENIELTMGTNHFGPFLLTNLLLEDLKTANEGGNGRIVNITSRIHDPEAGKRRNNLQPIDFENLFLNKEGTYNGHQAYKNSKAANIMFTYELARRLEGSGVTANCICPGIIPGTDLNRNASGVQKFLQRYVIHGMLRFTKMTRSVAQGAAAIVALATDEKYKEETGKFFKDGAEAKSSEETLNEENQKKLWEMSGGYLSMEGYEPLEIPEPPPPEEEKKVEKKEEKKEGENGDAKPAAEGEEEVKDGDNKTDEEKEKSTEKTEEKEETKDEEKKEEVKEEEKKEDEKKEVEEEKKEEETKEEVKEETKEEEKKEEVTAEENKEEEKKE